MTAIVIIVILLAVSIPAYFALRREDTSLEQAVKRWCKTQGVQLIGFEVGSRPSLGEQQFLIYSATEQSKEGYVQVTIRRPGAEIEVLDMMWTIGTMGPRLHSLQGPVDLPPGVEDLPPSPRELEMMEVSRRLDAITEEPDWVTAYDLDGSGHVDAEEWEILRQRVIADVRAEMEMRGTQTQPVDEHAHLDWKS